MTCEEAPKLLQERREAAQSGDTERIRDIDRERWEHEELNGYCECWQKARRAAVMRGKGMPQRKAYEQKFQIKASTASHLSRKEIQQLDQCSDESARRLLLGISR